MKAAIAALALAAGALLGAAPAQADTLGPFIDYLGANGIDVSTEEAMSADVELGRAICQLYGAAVKIGKDPNQDVLRTLERQRPSAEAAVWLVGSVNYVCPQWVPMLGGGVPSGLPSVGGLVIPGPALPPTDPFAPGFDDGD